MLNFPVQNLDVKSISSNYKLPGQVRLIGRKMGHPTDKVFFWGGGSLYAQKILDG